MSETHEHCKHFHDWPMDADQDEPYGDPGDGLGVQGACCTCDATQYGGCVPAPAVETYRECQRCHRPISTATQWGAAVGEACRCPAPAVEPTPEQPSDLTAAEIEKLQKVIDESTVFDPETGCRIWCAGQTQGYGTLRAGEEMARVHCIAWTIERGAIPKGLVIDHTCRNRRCCRVDHLRLVTRKINSLENSVSVPAKNAAKQHCPKCGGEYVTVPKLGRAAGRVCKPCKAETFKLWRASNLERLQQKEIERWAKKKAARFDGIDSNSHSWNLSGDDLQTIQDLRFRAGHDVDAFMAAVKRLRVDLGAVFVTDLADFATLDEAERVLEIGGRDD